MLYSALHVPTFVLNGDPACAYVDPELFFPQEIEIGDSAIVSKYANIAAAKAICNSCPLIVPCLEYAINNSEIGIWGGTTESQRDGLRKSSKVLLARRPVSPLYR